MNRVANQNLDDIRSALAAERPAVAVSAVIYEEGDTATEAVVTAFKSLTQLIGPQFADAAAPRPFAWDSWEPGVWSVREEDLWHALGNELTVFLPKAPSGGYLPSLTLVLPVRRVYDQQSRSMLWERLRTQVHRYSSIAIVLVDGDASAQEREAWQRTSWPGWLKELRGAAEGSKTTPCGVHLYLAGVTTSAGELISLEELGLAVAHALLADIAPRQRTAERILARTPTDAQPSVSILGASGQIAGADILAASLSRQMFERLYEAIQTGSFDEPDLPGNLVPTTDEMLAHAFAGQLPWETRGLLAPADSHQKGDYQEPAILCRQARFSVRVGDDAIATRLEKLPANLWRVRLAEWNTLLSDQRVAQIGERIEAVLQAREEQIQDRIRHLLARTFASRLQREPIERNARRILEQLATRRTWTVVGVPPDDGADKVTQALQLLDRRVAGLSVWKQAAWACFLAGVIASGMIWGTVQYLERGWWSWGIGAAAAVVTATILTAAGRSVWAWRQACAARDQALEVIFRRAQAGVLRRTSAKLSQIQQRWDVSVRSVSAQLIAAVQALTDQAREHPAADTSVSQLFERPRERAVDGTRAVRPWLLGRINDSVLTDKFHERCVDLGDELGQGIVLPVKSPSKLLAFVENELALRLSGHVELWKFYTDDGLASSFDEGLWEESVQRWSYPVLMGGKESESWVSDQEVELFWICPGAMASRVTRDSCRLLVSMPDRAVALWRARLELGVLERLQGDSSSGSPDQPEAAKSFDPAIQDDGETKGTTRESYEDAD